MVSTCKWCSFETWRLSGPEFVVLMCRRCDTVAQGGGKRVGPPNTPGSEGGWFSAPFGDAG